MLVFVKRSGLMDNNILSNMESIDIQTESLADKVYNIIESNIINVKIPPGANLSEDNIAKSLNISRSPVREALFRLEYTGLVKKSSTGRVVAEIDKKELIDNYQAWKMTESFTAVLASKNATEEDIKKLEKTKRLLETFTDTRRLDEYRKYNYEFHAQLVAPCPNNYLINIHKNILNRVQWCYNYSISLISDMKLSTIFHEKIFEAYKNEELENLETYIKDHIQAASERFQKAWDEKETNQAVN